MNMAFGQMVAGRIGFPWGVAPGYVEYGRWPKRRRGGSDFHGALPQAMLNMAVGKMVAGRIGFPWGVAPGYVEYGRWPNGDGADRVSVDSQTKTIIW